MVPISMDGNFQLKRFNQSFDSSAVDPCAEIVNSLWKANNDVVTSEYNVSMGLCYLQYYNVMPYC